MDVVKLHELVAEKVRKFRNEFDPKVLEINSATLRINDYIEHTNLKPAATTADIEKLCAEAVEYRFRGVCVNPVHVPLVTQLLKGSDVLIVTVVGFPLGATSTAVKAFEAEWCVKNGAHEIDMVVNVGKLKDGDFEFVYEDIRSVVECAGVPVKVIIETCYLTDEEKVSACVLSKLAGAKFVKTSTGFGPEGAKFEDVQLMRWAVDGEIGVKASGGVRTLDDALRMLRAGATRIGTSSGVNICSVRR